TEENSHMKIFQNKNELKKCFLLLNKKKMTSPNLHKLNGGRSPNIEIAKLMAEENLTYNQAYYRLNKKKILEKAQNYLKDTYKREKHNETQRDYNWAKKGLIQRDKKDPKITQEDIDNYGSYSLAYYYLVKKPKQDAEKQPKTRLKQKINEYKEMLKKHEERLFHTSA
ncbi:MAG: hypothetical protein ACK5XN_38280, partial [Bacteroidota bacterium]